MSDYDDYNDDAEQEEGKARKAGEAAGSAGAGIAKEALKNSANTASKAATAASAETSTASGAAELAASAGAAGAGAAGAVATEGAGAAAAAAGTIGAPVIAVAAIAVALILLLLIIANLPEIVMRRLGFTSADNYYDTMFSIELKDVEAGLPKMYGSSPNSSIDSAMQTQISEVKDQIDSYYNSTVSENTDRAVEYDGYSIDQNDYSGFWSSQEYVEYFAGPIVNYGSSDVRQGAKNNTNKDEVTSFLVSYVNSGDFFYMEELDDTYEMIESDTKFELDSNGDIVYEKVVLTDDEGNEIIRMMPKKLMVKHITKHYAIRMGNQESATKENAAHNYAYATDENVFNNIIKFIQNLEDENKYDNQIVSLFKGTVKYVLESLKALFIGDGDTASLRTFDKSIDYRVFLESSFSSASGTGGEGTFTDTGDVEKSMYLYFRSVGLSAAGAAGICGNSYAESSFNPTSTNSTGSFYGLFQLSRDLQAQLDSYCSSHNLSRSTVEGQCKWLNYYLQKNHSKLYNYLKSATDPSLAAQEFCADFEGCVSNYLTNNGLTKQYDTDAQYFGSLLPKRYGKYYQGLQTREDEAIKCYNKYKDLSVPTTSNVFGSSDGYNIDMSKGSATVVDGKGVSHTLYASEDVTGSNGVKGSAVVAYALQFVGNPYVWGGNSLTNGCDCSGFCHLILQHFGISSPRYSQSFLSYGTTVSSTSNLRLGDIIVYEGHVAMYAGNGMIVEAKGRSYGITCDRTATHTSIKGMRRYIK